MRTPSSRTSEEQEQVPRPKKLATKESLKGRNLATRRTLKIAASELMMPGRRKTVVGSSWEDEMAACDQNRKLRKGARISTRVSRRASSTEAMSRTEPVNKKREK